MARATLRYAIAIDEQRHQSGAADPVVHVYGSRGGPASPFRVRRGWSGPQGLYVEEFRIVRADTRITAYRSEPRVVDIAGEYYTTDLEDRLDDVRLEVGEYELVFTMDRDVIPGVPVFVEPGPGAVGGGPAVVPPIIDEATKKSDICWIGWPGLEGQSARGAWFLYHQGAVYVVFGGSEQQLPGLESADSAIVSVRSKDKGSLLVSWRAAVDIVPPGSALWEEVTPLLMGKRLNSRDGDEAGTRWARECRIARLVPTGALIDDPDNPFSGSRAAPPAPTTAGTDTRIPITLHNAPKGAPGALYGSPQRR
ncbi:MAG: hypothetical protein ABR520_06300 [Mycobacteriales bacterium]|nr:hypothetical protein [Frankia sp.]